MTETEKQNAIYEEAKSLCETHHISAESALQIMKIQRLDNIVSKLQGVSSGVSVVTQILHDRY